MGLDVVELVMRCEEVFAIELRDEDMERVQTVGDLYAAVCNELKLTPLPNPTMAGGRARISRASLNPLTAAWNAEDVWATLRAIVINQLQVNDEDVVPSAHFQYDLGADQRPTVQQYPSFMSEHAIRSIGINSFITPPSKSASHSML